MKFKRNDPCPCQSGKKYKKCCILYEDNETFQPSRRAVKNMPYTYELVPEMNEVFEKTLKQIERGNLVEAKKVAEKLYQDYPNNDLANYLLGLCYACEEEYEDSIIHFETALQINPSFPEAYYNLAISCLKAVHIGKAVDSFKRVLELEGKNSELGKLAQKEMKELAAMIQITSGLSLDEHIESEKSFDQAFVQLRNKKYEKAILLFRRVLAIEPDHVQSYGNIALAYCGLGKNRLALECLDKALELDPSYEPAQNNRDSIAELNEGECLPGIIQEVHYYQSGMNIKRIFW